jgi:hypothetical protein
MNTDASELFSLTPPRGAAIAGVIFSMLTITGLGLARYAIPADATNSGTWLMEPGRREAVRLSLDLVPFAGISFLWFIGMRRDRLGDREDQFFATVFLGSGLLFVASLFSATAVTDAFLEAPAIGKSVGEGYYIARRLSDTLLNLFAIKMAGVFIISTCTIGLRFAIFPRWVAYVGYACAALLLVVIANWRWIALLFPGWMLLLSIQILVAEHRSRNARGSTLTDAQVEAPLRG